MAVINQSNVRLLYSYVCMIVCVYVCVSVAFFIGIKCSCRLLVLLNFQVDLMALGNNIEHRTQNRI